MSELSKTPYQQQPPEAFWRTAVAEPGIWNLQNLWRSKWQLPANAAFATYGSCFAQHISRALQAAGKPWINAEPCPETASPELATKFGYGVYSSRTANIYSAKMLALWADLAQNPDKCADVELWQDGVKPGRNFRDSLRPTIEPEGFESAAECLAMLKNTARAFGRSVSQAQVFVFTMGLTEGFENARTGQPYALCPGTIAGTYNAAEHVFHNASYPEVRASMEAAITALKQINPSLKILLTVSPVPLTATADKAHVLLATTYSKSTLRAVAGDLAASSDDVDYFPSYELISQPPTRGIFFEPNMRSVSLKGVELVMWHFFNGMRFTKELLQEDPGEAKRRAKITTEDAAAELACEEETLDQQAST